MRLFKLKKNSFEFPPAWKASEDGILAVGGDLHPDRLLAAYRSGIFPWYNEPQPPLWWSPDPRFVLFPQKLKISKTMRQVLRRGEFEITFDQEFEHVMRYCQHTPRSGQDGSWINEDIVAGFLELHRRGYAHSVEAWKDDVLVGGLYGGAIGKCFFGESMFAHQSNASKAAFITMVHNLLGHGYELIDCQVYTEHLESLGAESIPRSQFLDLIGPLCAQPGVTDWEGVFENRPFSHQ